MSRTTADPAVLTHRDVPLDRAEGLRLLGAVEGSGYRRPPSLVRRGDGQTVQLTELLYAVLEAIDGRRTPAEVAEAVSETTGRPVSEDNVWTLVETQLRPLGLLRMADGSQPEVRKSDPLLGLRLRWVVSDPRRTRAITAPFAVLFAPVVVAVLTLAFLVTSGWVLFEKGLAAATSEAFDRPGLLLLVFAVTVLSAGFHEFGHAAACRYGGATPGVMGMGLYLVWPAFYTDVTDSYRLDRAGRVRVDLGGLYFNAVVAVAMFGVWAATHFDALLLIIAAQVLQMIRQLTPLVRFDGYHVLADITGVPDLYSHIGPTLRGLLPGNWHRPEGKVLKPWARAVVTTWVVLVVPLLLAALVLIVMAFPRVAATAWAGLGKQWALLEARVVDGDPTGITLRILAILSLALPVLATAYLLIRLVRRAAVGTWRATEGHPWRRAVAGVTALALVVALGWVWWPRDDTYEPIRPTEHGTVFDAISDSGPMLRDGQVASARTLWASTEPAPARDKPRLALVLVPRDPDAPTWVFPFNRPDAPLPGGNQALAVNTTNGSTVYDVAFALVWADDGDPVLNRNEAYALASCKRCKTVAVGFQVVLVVGQADVVVPQNISAAVNYNCVSCVTYALAQQLVLTLPRNLSPAAMAELERVWRQVERFGTRIRGVPLSRIRARLAKFERKILDIVRRDVGAAPATGATASASATAGPAGSAPADVTTTPAPSPTATDTGASPASSEPAPASGSPTPSGTSPTPTTSTATTTP